MAVFENKHISGMIHLGSLDWEQRDKTYESALKDAKVLAEAGLDSLLLENWNDGPLDPGQVLGMIVVGQMVAKEVSLPWGVNVLPNDWRNAFYVASRMDAKFVELDVFVDEVEPPERVEPEVIQHYRKESPECRGIEFYPMIHPKHRTMVDKSKSLLISALEAKKYGANGVVITGAFTGRSPDVKKLADFQKDLNKWIPKFPIVIGSGLTADNAADLLKYANGAIVGTYLKVDGVTDNPVDYKRAKKLMDVVRKLR